MGRHKKDNKIPVTNTLLFETIDITNYPIVKGINDPATLKKIENEKKNRCNANPS